MARLKVRYQNEIAGDLFKKFGYKSVMQIPKLEKVVINVACGEGRDNPKIIEAIIGTSVKSPSACGRVPCQEVGRKL
jgi:large subunit ribosomal protein L5